MCMEPIFTVSLPGCYLATVNEPETITVAQPFCPVRAPAKGPRARDSGPGPGSDSGLGFPATAQVERSSTITYVERSSTIAYVERS
jgi:hypothetical protein